MSVKRESQRHFTIRIQISLMFFLVSAMALIAAIIFVPMQLMSRDHTIRLVADLNKEIMGGVRNEIIRVFEKAIVTQNIVRETFAQKIVDLGDKALREKFCLNLLRANPNFTWISIGYPNGDFFGVQRESEKEQINVIYNTWDAASTTGFRHKDIYLPVNAAGTAYRFHSSTSFRNDYNSLDRPWYKKAVQEISDIWTDVYIFDTSKKPGINAAVALVIDGKTVGVISVAFELEDISLYLKGLKIGKTGTCLIIDSMSQVLATQNPAELVYESASEPLKKIDQLENPFIQVAARAYRGQYLAAPKTGERSSYQYADSGTGNGFFVTFMQAQHLDWTIVTVIPDLDYLGEIQRNSLIILSVVVAAVVLVILFTIILSKGIIVRPILRITDQLVHVQNFNLDRIVPVPSRIKEIQILNTSIRKMTQGLLSFEKYIPTELVREMISQGIQAEPGGQERELTILFTDIVSFTSILEKHGNALIPQLGEYLNVMSDIFLREKGAIDKYIGDSVMAFWGAPVKNEEHARSACKAALDAQKALEKMVIAWEKAGRPAFRTRIGINTGTVLVGNVGSDKRLNYTVVGDPVNLASRLEGLNKVYKTGILIGHTTYQKVMEHIVARKVDSAVVIGKSEREDIYELLAMRDELRVTDNFDWIKVYENAHRLYQARDFAGAMREFKRVSGLRGKEDYPSKYFSYICDRFLKTPPPAGWQGVSIMKSK